MFPVSSVGSSLRFSESPMILSYMFPSFWNSSLTSGQICTPTLLVHLGDPPAPSIHHHHHSPSPFVFHVVLNGCLFWRKPRLLSKNTPAAFSRLSLLHMLMTLK